jgi:hypothetical protein
MATGLLQSLQSERNDLTAEERDIVAAAERRGGLNDEDRTRLAAIDTRVAAIDGDVNTIQASNARRLNEPVLADEVAQAAAIAAVGTPTPAAAPKPFATFGDQLFAIRNSSLAARSGGAPDNRLIAVQEFARQQATASGLQESVGGDGGFAVQTDFVDAILARIDTEAVLWPQAFPVPLSANSNGAKINQLDETSRATGSRWGGVQVYWEAEATTVTAKKPKITPLELTLQKLASWYINQEVWPQLFNLQQVIGVGGVPVFIPPGQASGQPVRRLRGRPVRSSSRPRRSATSATSSSPTGASTSVIRKGGIQSASSIHVYFDTDETAFRWVLRSTAGRGGTPRHALQGLGTLSPFVTLQAR